MAGRCSGSPQQASGPANLASTGSEALTAATLQTLVDAAINHWTAALGDGSRTVLKDASFRIADLPGTYLGWTSGSVVWIDRDAAGYGWFIDASPLDDSEFGDIPIHADFVAGRTNPAIGRMDLLTVIAHELGHVLGIDDPDPFDHPDDLMTETLSLSIRRLPVPPVSIPQMTHRDDPVRRERPAGFGLGAATVGGVLPGEIHPQFGQERVARPVSDAATVDLILESPGVLEDLLRPIVPLLEDPRRGSRPLRRRLPS